MFPRNYSIFLILIFVLVFSACKKEDDTVRFDTAAAESEIAMIMALDDVEYITYEGLEQSNNIMEGRLKHDEGPLGSTCVSISFNTQQNTTTVDFGNGCEGPDKKVRKGKIIISQTGKYFEPGTVVTSVLENYSVNDILLEGIITITNTSPERTMTPTFSITIENGKANWPDQSFASREMNYTRLWMRSENHAEMQYLISGSASGIDRNGKTYTSEINNFLTYKLSCLEEHTWLPVTGTLSLFGSEEAFQIDYGNGACDNEVTISQNDNLKKVTLF